MASGKIVLITGCSQGGLGDALAREFHRRDFRIIATGRNLDKMAHLRETGIEIVELDIQSSDSVSHCYTLVQKMVGDSLHILINNAGRGYSMPLSDTPLEQVRNVFELNVTSVIAVTQAFLPMILHARGMIVNQSSISSVVPVAMTGVYNASKAAVAQFTDTMRSELAPFDVRVVDLKTGAVMSHFY